MPDRHDSNVSRYLDSFFCSGRRQAVAFDPEIPPRGWHHEDRTPCEGPTIWAARQAQLACGLRAGHGVYIAEVGRRRGSGWVHCDATCPLAGSRPRGPLGLDVLDYGPDLSYPWRPCGRCSHEGGWRRGLPNAALGLAWPQEPRCRPVGRDDWLYAAVVGSTVRVSGLAPGAAREIGQAGIQRLLARLEAPPPDAASHFLAPRNRPDNFLILLGLQAEAAWLRP